MEMIIDTIPKQYFAKREDTWSIENHYGKPPRLYSTLQQCHHAKNLDKNMKLTLTVTDK